VAAACRTGASRFNDPVRAGDPRRARTRSAFGTVSRQRGGGDPTRENVVKQVTSLDDAAQAAAGRKAFDVTERSASDQTSLAAAI
jgi:hypothetical protein